VYPVLFSSQFLKIHSYGLLVAIGVLCALCLVRWSARKQGLNPDLAVDLSLFIIFFGFVGARLFYVGLYWDYFVEEPFEILKIWKGGIVYYGGMIGGLAGFAVGHRLLLKSTGTSFLEALDLVVPAIALAQGFGRVGCFLNGCCFGSESDLPWAVQFPFATHLVHPVQLYESIFCFLLTVHLVKLSRRRHSAGAVAFSFFSWYAVGRFIIELVRGDNPSSIFGLTVPQLMSVGILACTIITFLALTRNGRKAV
jgi:phosphatidylglycerol---prolipoprotein diacylglyceryl transferase